MEKSDRKYSYGIHLKREEEVVLQQLAEISARNKRNVLNVLIMNSQKNVEFMQALGVSDENKNGKEAA